MSIRFKLNVEVDSIRCLRPAANLTQDKLQSIFQEVGIEVRLSFDQDDIPRPLLKKGNSEIFTPGLLHDYMQRYRRVTAQSEEWYAHVLLVPRIFLQEGGKVSECRGIMFDEGYGRPREGCAIAAGIEDHENPAILLRTFAHELGHVLNLLHPVDEYCWIKEDGNYLMHMLEDVSEPDAYAFGTGDKRFLREVPPEYVKPGGERFRTRPEGFCAWSDRELRGPGPFSIRLKTERETHTTLGPVHLGVTITNRGDATEFDSLPSVSTGGLQILIRKTAPVVQPSFRFRAPLFACAIEKNVTLGKDRDVHTVARISGGNDGAVFDSAGVYEIQAIGRFRSAHKWHEVRSEPISIQVEDADSESLALASAKNHALRLFLALRGGGHLPGAENLARQLIKSKDALTAADARLALASHHVWEKGDFTSASEALEGTPDLGEESLLGGELALLHYEIARGLNVTTDVDRKRSIYKEAIEKTTPDADDVLESTEHFLDAAIPMD